MEIGAVAAKTGGDVCDHWAHDFLGITWLNNFFPTNLPAVWRNYFRANQNHPFNPRNGKENKGNDDTGVVAELVKCSPEEFLLEWLVLYSNVLFIGDVPTSWSSTRFIMFPKSKFARGRGEFRPIVLLHVLQFFLET